MKGEERKEMEGRGKSLRIPDQKKKQSPVTVLIWTGVLRRRAGRSTKKTHGAGTL